MANRNLASDREVVITNFVPMENSYASNDKGRRDILTNGVIGDPTSCYGGDWVHFYRGVGRTLTVDLGDVYAVNGFDIGFIHDKNAGIYSPECVKLQLSENGIDYYCVSSVDSPYPASFGMQVRAVYAATTKPYRARYARIEFTVEVNSFCDELRIYGDDVNGYEYPLSGDTVKEINKSRFALRDSLDGVYDLPLLYFGYWPEDERVARLKKEDFLPYVAYIDRNGEPIDLMFDAVLMLMVQGRCPSGGCLSYNGAPSKLSDWEYIIDELFADGYNLKALDEAVGELKSKGLPKAYKHSVYLTAPVPKVSLEPFGDLNGDGIEEKLLSTEDCINAYAQYVDAVTRRFEAQCFENIRLDGWFWNNESASRASRDDEYVFAKGCVDALHQRGYKCVFIPYFQAGGCEKADEIGFDCTTMQPGLSFQEVLGRNPAGMMEDFTSLCGKYGFGVELEVHHGVKNQETMAKYARLFDEYLIACMKNGMMTDTVHTYYQAAGPGVFHFCAYSKDETARSLYDKLYKFIKGTLSESDFECIPVNIPEVVEVEEETETVESVVTAPAAVESVVTEPVEVETVGIDIDSAEVEAVEDDFDDAVEIVELKPKKKRIEARSFVEKHKKAICISACAAAAASAVCLLIKAMKGKD